MYTFFIIAELLVHASRDEEVGDDIVALCFIITQLDAGRAFLVALTIEDIEVPLDDIPRVGILFVDAFAPQFVAHFVVLGVAYVVGALVVILYEALGRIEVVNDFAVILLLVHPVRQRVVTDERIYDGFEDDVEALHQEVFLLVGIDKYLSRHIEESIAQLPQLQGLVREILVFDLLQTHFAVATQIPLKLPSFDEREITVYVLIKTILVTDEVQDGKKITSSSSSKFICRFLFTGFI